MTDEDSQSESGVSDPEWPSTWSPPPTWMRSGPDGAGVDPPVETRPSVLPLGELSWKQFERLCLRILETDVKVVHAEARTAPAARMYGTQGQAQDGIDLYARDSMPLGQTPPPRRYVTLQARRVKGVTARALRDSVEDFLDGKWAPASRKFIYATSLSGASNDLRDEVERLAGELSEAGIEFEVWDQEELSSRLRGEPWIVDDFFSRPWVERFCGVGAAAELGDRLDGPGFGALRTRLAGLYRTVFGFADSGLLALRADAGRALPLRERFVTPDVISTSARDATIQRALDDQLAPDYSAESSGAVVNAEAPPWPGFDGGSPFGTATGTATGLGAAAETAEAEDRMSAGTWLGQSFRQVVVGDPGAGKSTMLRYLVLDLLADEPTWTAVTERWGQRLPVWLPFHFFTQRVVDRTGTAASLGGAIRAWLEQHDVGDLWPLVDKALSDDRLLLVVDGLDEWVSDEAGRYAASAVETFAETHRAAVVVSSRPYGLSRLTLGAGWDYGRIAPLSTSQQRELALYHHRASTAGQGGQASAEAIESSVDAFLAQVRASPDLRAISGIPLFLVLLVGLRLSNVARLPDRRFDVYDGAIDLLVADHPQKRRVAAAVTATRQRLTDQQTRSLLAHAAFASLSRGDVATIDHADARGNLVAALTDLDYLALQPSAAGIAADELLDIAEGELGVLVRKGPEEFAFVHRMIQEQLAAEHAANRLAPQEQAELVERHLGDPVWRETLLGILWRTRRPAELRKLVEVVEASVGETPEGLRAREILAEATFGPYDLPGVEARRHAADLIDTIEHHPYDQHRSRLITSAVSGLESLATREMVAACLPRWTLQVRPPSPSLGWHLSQLAPHKALTQPVRTLLMAALRYDDEQVAYSAAASIASRCGEDGNATGPERDEYLRDLLGTVAHPRSATHAAAALTAMALAWHDEEPVRSALVEARNSGDEAIRVVALGHAMGVLRAGLLSDHPPSEDADVSALNPDERGWLVERLEGDRFTRSHGGILTAALVAAVRGDDDVLDYCVQRIRQRTGVGVDLAWSVALRAFPDSERLAEAVCREFRTQKHPLFSRLTLRYDDHIAVAYGPESEHHDQVASAIEDHLESFGGRYRDMELSALADIDRGPTMRRELLRALSESSHPHWAAAALAEHFADDAHVRETIESILAGDPAKASLIANAVPKLHEGAEAVDRLLAILRGIAGYDGPQRARPDIAALALVRACREHGLTEGPEAEAIAAETISLLSRHQPEPWQGDPVYDLAVAFHPSEASRAALERLADRDDHPIEPFLVAFRDDPLNARRFVDEASEILRTIPPNLRAHLCRLLADRPDERALTVELTRRWADEHAEANKSVASLAHHLALLEARRDGEVDDRAWVRTLDRLSDQAGAYGPDHEARRQAAWVGMCVIGDWTLVDDRIETIGDPTPVGVTLATPLHGTDDTLVQQIASRWQELRDHFGDALIARLSGIREDNAEAVVWSALARGARGHPELQRELEAAVADNPELLAKDGVLAWYATHARGSDQLADAIVSRLRQAESNVRGIASVLMMEPERLGLDRTELIASLEGDAQQPHVGWGNPALEALAALDANHPTVQSAWQTMQDQIAAAESTNDSYVHALPHPQSYLAVGYAAIDSDDIVDQIARDRRWLSLSRNEHFDSAFTRSVSHRLRRDTKAAQAVRDSVLDDATPDALGVVLASLLTVTVAPDQTLLDNIHGRLGRLDEAVLAPVIYDHVTSTAWAARTVLVRAAEAAWK